MYIGRSQQEEEKYLQTTIKAINELIEEFGGLSTEQDKEIRKQRKFLWDNRNEFDEFEVLENCSQIALEEKTYANKLNKLKSLERQLKSPYFARLDFKEKGEEGDSFYIGLASVEDKDNFDFYVFDWRSPVANMFYDFEVGPAFYNAPIGKIEGDIEFSRQFNIKNSKIVFTHDSGAALCDESLTAMLDRNATDKMKNIVATIQKEQNDFIRNDDAKTLFIQGAAGSGKTSIALHRAAYILYKHRKNLQADNILIFSPNEVFAEYISDVLPELGENNVLQTTFDAYAKKSLPADYYFENKAEHLDYLYSGDQELANRVLAMEYKNSMKFMEIIESFCRDLPEKLVKCKPIFIDGKQIIPVKSVANTFLKRFNDIPLLNRLDVVKQSIFSQVENRFLNSDSGDYDFEYVEDKENFYEHCKTEINAQIDNMVVTFNTVEIYKLLWSNIENYCNDDLSKVKEITLGYLNNREVKYEDITPMLYIRAAMEGFRNYKNVKHILIDEAQDYSPLFYELIRKSFKNAAITIMGDLNQRIDEHSNVKNRNAITEIFNDIKIEVLSKSYRSTANITNFTRELLDTHEPIEAVERSGDNPKVIITKNRIVEVAKTIETMQEKGYKSIAVICKTKAITNDVYHKLKEVLVEINLIDTEISEFKIGVNVISSYLSKGLEFDGVIVADGEEYLNESNKNLFYTVCTRALHELKVFTKESLEEMLPSNKTLYEIEER